jgi:DNA polymerase-3 subunit epsilon
MKEAIDTSSIFFKSLLKPVLFFEVKTTGLDVVEDRILELTYIKFLPGIVNPISGSHRFNPIGREITHSAFLEHGIDIPSIEKEPSFGDKALSLYSVFNKTDMVGTNALFHRLMLESEFNRCGLKLDKDVRVCNPLSIWHNMTSSGIEEACAYYQVPTIDGSVFSNLVATANVLSAQITKHNLSPDFSALQASSFSTDNLLHLAIGKYASNINSYRKELDQKSLNTDIIQEAKASNKDVGIFLLAMSNSNIDIEYGEQTVSFTRGSALVNLRYDFFKDIGLDIKPTKAAMLGYSL